MHVAVLVCTVGVTGQLLCLCLRQSEALDAFRYNMLSDTDLVQLYRYKMNALSAKYSQAYLSRLKVEA